MAAHACDPLVLPLVGDVRRERVSSSRAGNAGVADDCVDAVPLSSFTGVESFVESIIMCIGVD